TWKEASKNDADRLPHWSRGLRARREAPARWPGGWRAVRRLHPLAESPRASLLWDHRRAPLGRADRRGRAAKARKRLRPLSSVQRSLLGSATIDRGGRARRGQGPR